MTAIALGVYGETGVVPRPELVAGVEVFDTRLRPVGTVAVRAGELTFIDLPGPGRYLLRGWDPAGAELRRTVTVAAGEPPPAVGLTVGPAAGPAGRQPRPDSPPAEPPRVAVRPVDAGPPRGPDELELTDPEVVVPVPAAGALLTIWQPAGWSTVTAVTAGATVEIVANPTGEFPRWLPRLAAGSVSTLLSYLWTGDLPSAGIVARALQEDLVVPGLAGNLLADLAVGYYLLRHGDPGDSPWLGWLDRSWSGSTDVALLDAELALRRGGRPPADTVARLLASTSAAMPVLAEGTRRLWHCLGVLGSHPPRPDPIAEQVGARLRARLPTVLATHLVDPSGRVSPPPVPLPATPYELLPASGGWRLRAVPTSAPRLATRSGMVGSLAPPRAVGISPDPWWRLPRFELAAPRAAAEPSPPPGTEPAWTSPDGRWQVARQVVPGGRLLIALRWRGSAGDDLVRLRVTSGGTAVDYLVPLVPDPSGVAAGAVTVPVAGSTAETALDQAPAPAAQLAGVASELVTRSVRAASGRGQDAWRAIARARPTTDPVRAAVVAALTDHPPPTDVEGDRS